MNIYLPKIPSACQYQNFTKLKLVTQVKDFSSFIILSNNVLESLQSLWHDKVKLKRQLLVEILDIVQFPDFSLNVEDYGIKVKQHSSKKSVLTVKITKQKKKLDEDDDEKVRKQSEVSKPLSCIFGVSFSSEFLQV